MHDKRLASLIAVLALSLDLTSPCDTRNRVLRLDRVCPNQLGRN